VRYAIKTRPLLVFRRLLRAVDDEDFGWRVLRFEFQVELFLNGRKD